MIAIRNYTDTKCELEIAKTRLSVLMERKEKLYCKYFPVTTKIKDELVDSGEQQDKMTSYLQELYEIDYGTGKSLYDELNEEQEVVNKLQKYLDVMSESLSKLTGIEHQLFYEIVYKGTPITKSVDKISNKYNLDTSNVWKHYYRRIKKYIKKLKSPVICQ